jgi:hypothetical protein
MSVQKFKIPVVFDGVVEVELSEEVPEAAAKSIAELVALDKVVAEWRDDISDYTEGRCDGLGHDPEHLFKATILSVGGAWDFKKPSADSNTNPAETPTS